MDKSKLPPGVSLHTGFPNPAADSTLGQLDLNRLLVPRPASTFLFRVRGNEWESAGIFDGDIAIIDRAPSARANNLVLYASETTGEFSVCRLRVVPADAEVWGVVTAIIHQLASDNSSTKAAPGRAQPSSKHDARLPK